MIYTIGYARLTPGRLSTILDLLHVDLLIDARSSPRTRVAGMGMLQLNTRFGSRYQWRGETLGGRIAIAPKAIAALAEESRSKTLMVMCMEEAPAECHRHHTIARPLGALGIPVSHVYREEIVSASELDASIEKDRDYECEDLFAHASARAEILKGIKE